jgi:hypothetical protein
VTIQRPDKLRIIIPGNGPASEYYYDGKTAIAYAPAENIAAIADAARFGQRRPRDRIDVGEILVAARKMTSSQI